VLPNMADKDKMAKYRTEIQQVSCSCALFLLTPRLACSVMAFISFCRSLIIRSLLVDQLSLSGSCSHASLAH
jgi:hypothetical protein